MEKKEKGRYYLENGEKSHIFLEYRKLEKDMDAIINFFTA